MGTIFLLLQRIGELAGLVLTATITFYFIPGSPLKRAFETWIERRVSQRFDKELESFRHRLALDAESVRAEHQRVLHNAALVTERKHEVYRELFKLLHIANGATSALYGFIQIPAVEQYNRQDIANYLETLRPPSDTKRAILDSWDVDKRHAVEQVRIVERQFAIHRAEEAIKEAWNYYLLNSLYLDDFLASSTAEIFKPLRSILSFARMPEPGGTTDISKLKSEASDRLEGLLRTFRDRLRVSEEHGVIPRVSDTG